MNLQDASSKQADNSDLIDQTLMNDLKQMVIEYQSISENEITLMSFLLKDCARLNVRIQLKTLSLIKCFMSKRKELEVFLQRMVLINGEDEMIIFKKYSELSDRLMASSESLRLRIFTRVDTSDQETESHVIFTSIIQELLEVPEKNLLDSCPTKELVSLNWETPIDIELKQVIASNMRSRHTKLDAVFQHLNFSMDIVRQILIVTSFKIKLSDEATDIRSTVFTYVFRYLEWFFYGNCSLKSSMHKEMMEIIQVAEISNECQCRFLLFMREWTKDNEKLLLNIEDVIICAKKLLDIILRQTTQVCTIGSLAMNVLSKLTRFKNKMLKENQKELVSLIFSIKYKLIFDHIAGNSLLDILSDILYRNGSLAEFFTVQKTKVMVSDVDARFIVHYLLLLNACTEGSNSFTEDFCQKLYSPEIFHRVLEMPKMTFEIKSVVIDYLLFAYLQSEQMNTLSIIYIVTRMLPLLVAEFDAAVKTILDQSEDYSEMAEIVVLSENSCQVFETMVEKYAGKLAKMFEEIVQLGLEEREYSGLASVIESNMLKVLVIIDKNLAKVLTELNHRVRSLVIKIIKLPSGLKIPSLASKAEDIDDKFNLSTDQLAHNKLLVSQRIYTPRKDDTLNMSNIMNELINISRIENASSQYKEQFNKMCAKLVEATKDDNCSLHEIGSVLLKTLATEEHIEQVDSQIYRFTINLLQFYLDDSGDGDNLLEQRQNDLIELGCIENISTVLCLTDNDKIQLNCVDLMIAIFNNGNKDAQEIFKQIVHGTDKTTPSSVLSKIGMHLSKKVQQLNGICKKLRMENMELQFSDSKNDKFLPSRLLDLNMKCKLTKGCTAYIRMLQCFCEGHNYGIQQLMLSQNRDYKDHNFLQSSILVYGIFLKYLDDDIEKLISQSLNFLVEAIQGPNRDNQEYVFYSKFFEYLNDYIVELEEMMEDNESSDRVAVFASIVQKSVSVLSSLLEGNTSRKELYTEIDKYISINSLMKVLTGKFIDYFASHRPQHNDPEYLLNTVKEQVFDKHLTEMFEIYFFIKYMDHNLINEDRSSLLNSLSAEEENCHRFFAYCSGSIEVIFQDAIELIHFIKQPASGYLSEENKIVFLDSVRRDSVTNKLTDLQLMSKGIMILMNYNNYSGRSGGFIIRASRLVYIYIGHFINFFVLLLIIMVFLIDKYDSEGFMSIKPENSLLNFIRYMLLCLCIIRVLANCIYKGPLHLKEEWTREFTTYAHDLAEFVD